MINKKPLKILITILIACLVCAAGFLTASVVKNNQRYVVSFNTNGGTGVISPQTVRYGKTATEPQAPSKYGYRFLGWYKDPLCTVLYKFDSKVKSDMMLYADYIKAYKAEFEFCDYQIEAAWVDENTFLRRPSDPIRQGFEFIGWFTNKDFTKAYDFYSNVTENITLYAQWKRIYYTLTFDSLGGTEIEIQKVYVDEKPTKPDFPTKKDYAFHDWYMDLEYNYRFSFDSPLSDDIIIYAYWIYFPDTSVMVRYYLDTVENYLTGRPDILDYFLAEKGDLLLKPSDPVIDGYHFDGWYCDINLTTLFDFDKPLMSDTYIYGKLKKVE